VEFNEAFEKIWIIGNGKRVGDKESFTSLEIIKGTGRKTQIKIGISFGFLLFQSDSVLIGCSP
jgi:hypothetical protein